MPLKVDLLQHSTQIVQKIRVLLLAIVFIQCALFSRQTIQYHSIQEYAPTSNTEEAQLNSSMKTYKTFQNKHQKLTPFRTNTHAKNTNTIIADQNAKVGSQEVPGVIGKFGLGVQNEAGQRITEFCQENALVIANTLF